MIVRQTPHPFKIFFALRGSIIPKIYPQLLLVTILSTLITIIQHWFPDSFPYYGIATFTLLGIALSLFLGFNRVKNIVGGGSGSNTEAEKISLLQQAVTKSNILKLSKCR